MSKQSPHYSEDMQEKTSPFVTQVTAVLDNFNKLENIGDSSLATPYILGTYLRAYGPPETIDVIKRGKALQDLFRAVQSVFTEQGLDPDYGRVINVLFSEFTANKAVTEKKKVFGISRNSYNRKKKQAIAEFSACLLQYLKLPLRTAPPHHPHIFGRDEMIADCQEALIAGKSIGLYGLGGVGKTTLGSHLAKRLSFAQPFWFTFQKGLNDHLSSLLFVLDHYLRERLREHDLTGSNLLSLLLISKEYPRLEMALDFIQADLIRLAEVGESPILCFDEVDLLQADTEPYEPLRVFLEGLKALPNPMIFMGQRLPFEFDLEQELIGLTPAALAAWLQQRCITLSKADIAKLRHHVGGNPRLLKLFMALHQHDTPLPDLLKQLPEYRPTMDYLLERVWRRLAPTEKMLFSQLAVFRRGVQLESLPRFDVGKQQAKIDHPLLQTNQDGRVQLLPAFREIIYHHQLEVDERKNLHNIAADIRATYSEYTAAAHHFIQGGQSEIAVWQWNQHRQSEIEQGQGEVALQLFEALLLNKLPNEVQSVLKLNLSELYKLRGKYDKFYQPLREVSRHGSVFKAQEERLKGDVAELQSRYSRAIEAYKAGLETIEQLLYEKAIFHKNLSWIYQKVQDFDRAWYQAELAECEAKYMKGEISRERGPMQAAEQYYRESLAIAETIGYREGIAKNNEGLAIALVDLGREGEGEVCEEKALAIYVKMGRLTRIAGIRATQARRYNLKIPPQPEKAIEAAEKGLKLFQQLNEPRGETVACQNLAEAYQILEKWDEAERYAYQVVQTEEQAHLPDGLRVIGEIKLVRGELDEAQSYIQQSIDISQENQDPFLEAYAWRAMGRLHCTKGNEALAEQAFERAFALFEEKEAATEMTRTQEVRRECGAAE